MNQNEAKQLIKMAKQAEELVEKIEDIQSELQNLQKRKMKIKVVIQELRPSPSEFSSEDIWSSVRNPYVDYAKFEEMCTTELQKQLTEKLHMFQKRLEDLSV